MITVTKKVIRARLIRGSLELDSRELALISSPFSICGAEALMDSPLLITPSSLAAKSTMVVQIEEIEPCIDVLSTRAELGYGLDEIGERFGVTIRSAAGVVIAPCGDFPRLARIFCIRLNPREQFAIATPFCDLFFHRFMVEAGEVEKMPIHAFAVIAVFAEFAGEQ